MQMISASSSFIVSSIMRLNCSLALSTLLLQNFVSLMNCSFVMSLLYHTPSGTQQILSIYFIFLWMRWCNIAHGVTRIANLRVN